MADSFAIEPVVANFFELETTDLEISRDPGFAPTNIVSAGQQFDVALTFQGDQNGVFWQGLRIGTDGQPHVARIEYFAESMGPGGNNLVLGVRNIVLNPVNNVYGPFGPANENTRLIAVINQPGVYRLAAQISFTLYPFASGFYEGTLLSVR